MKRIFILLLSLMFSFSCSSKKQNNTTITMGTSPAFPPFEYIVGEEEIVGFDVELAKEIAQELNKSLVIKNINFSDLIAALENGEIDMIISGMTVTDERKKHINFSIPYYEASLVVLRRADDNTFADIKTLEELGESKSIAAQLGTTCSTIAHEISKASPVAELKSCELIIEELLNKNVDTVIIDKEPAKSFMSKHNNLSILPIKFDIEHYAVGVKKGNDELLNSINKTISELINSGKYIKFVDEHINSYSAE